jgi:hypothetical protein
MSSQWGGHSLQLCTRPKKPPKGGHMLHKERHRITYPDLFEITVIECVFEEGSCVLRSVCARVSKLLGCELKCRC